MKPLNVLNNKLVEIDKKGYKAYKSIKGAYDFADFFLFIDYVQGDPFANPSRVRVRLSRERSGFPPFTTKSESRTIALCDYLTREFYSTCKKICKGDRGSGKSGLITIQRPVQEILIRSAMVVTDDYVEARIFMGLPADGRRILAKQAIAMFFEELPAIVRQSLFYTAPKIREITQHIETSEDADFLRAMLPKLNLTAFVADGSHLPRASGINPKPLENSNVIPFKSPDELLVEVNLPNAGTIKGMGIPCGITLIVGGGFHGKSTLLNALELGIYNHIPGDGREYVVSNPDTIKLRAADGRSIVNTDISGFITNLPFNRNTEMFSTTNASGSTSQAAGICEALESGAGVFLLDEDTCATNFMIRDSLMQKLVEKNKEPITPYIDRVRTLFEDFNISTIIVMGGSGDYFSIADHVICMVDYIPHVVTQKAKTIAKSAKDIRISEACSDFIPIKPRIPLKESFYPFRSPGRIKIAANTTHQIYIGWDEIFFSDIEQIVEMSQTRAIAWAIYRMIDHINERLTLLELIEIIMTDIQKNGLESLTPEIQGDLSIFRPHELAAVINRARSLKMEQKNATPL